MLEFYVIVTCLTHFLFGESCAVNPNYGAFRSEEDCEEYLDKHYERFDADERVYCVPQDNPADGGQHDVQ